MLARRCLRPQFFRFLGSQICFFHENFIFPNMLLKPSFLLTKLLLVQQVWCFRQEQLCRLSKRPSKQSLIHFYKRCVSETCWTKSSSVPFFRSKETPIKDSRTYDKSRSLLPLCHGLAQHCSAARSSPLPNYASFMRFLNYQICF